MTFKFASICLVAALMACAPAMAQQHGAPAPAAAANPYTPYEFLIGDWESNEQMGAFVQRFSWGPRNSYIRYATSLLGANGAPEHLHFEGIAIYNGANHNLDFLVVVEPGSYGQEQGTIHAEPDGTIVREVTLTNSDGRVEHFRQTYRATGANTAITTLMRQAADGSWSPNFPGSENIVMRRRS